MTQASNGFPLGEEEIPLSSLRFQAACKRAAEFKGDWSEHIPMEHMDEATLAGLGEVLHTYYSRDLYLSVVNDEQTRLNEDQIRACFKHGLVGADPHTLTATIPAIENCCSTSASVLIQGETGSGKEVAARCIHDLSDRKAKPFIAVNCAGIPAQLIESQLFGHEKGAFTGATRAEKGFVEEADGGTLFLDEIGDMPPEVQVKLLRFLNGDGEVYRVGSTRPKTVDVRVISATNQDAGKKIRSDLYYRLVGRSVYLRPLYMRPGDLPILIYYIVERYNRCHEYRITGVAKWVLIQAMCYRWPGNVRELETLVESGCDEACARGSDCVFQIDIHRTIPDFHLLYQGDSDFIPEAKVREKLSIEDLLSLDLRLFMESFDKEGFQNNREWSMAHRLSLLAREEAAKLKDLPVATSAVKNPVPARPMQEEEPVWGLPYKELMRRYTMELKREHVSDRAAGKVAGVDGKTVRKWVELYCSEQ